MQQVQRPSSALNAVRQARCSDRAEQLAARTQLHRAWALVAVVLGAGCSGESNSVLSENPRLSGGGGSTASGDGDGEAPSGGGMGPAPDDTGGSNGMVGSGGSESVGGSPALANGGTAGQSSTEGCEARTSITLAVHV